MKFILLWSCPFKKNTQWHSTRCISHNVKKEINAWHSWDLYIGLKYCFAQFLALYITIISLDKLVVWIMFSCIKNNFLVNITLRRKITKRKVRTLLNTYMYWRPVALKPFTVILTLDQSHKKTRRKNGRGPRHALGQKYWPTALMMTWEKSSHFRAKNLTPIQS
jgi:hypothetical protein